MKFKYNAPFFNEFTQIWNESQSVLRESKDLQSPVVLIIMTNTRVSCIKYTLEYDAQSRLWSTSHVRFRAFLKLLVLAVFLLKATY